MSRKSYAHVASAVGAGVAAGFASLLGRRRVPIRQAGRNRLEPLIERLDRIEARVALAEDLVTHAEDTPGLALALAAHAEQLELLRGSAAEGERLAAAEIRLSQERFQEFTAALPAAVDAVVTPRVDHLRERLRTEMEKSVARTLQTFEQAFNDRVSARIDAVEQRLLGQSETLADLRLRAGMADQNLQKLVNAVEKLCEEKLYRQEAVSAVAENERGLEHSFVRGTELPGRGRVIAGTRDGSGSIDLHRRPLPPLRPDFVKTGPGFYFLNKRSNASRASLALFGGGVFKPGAGARTPPFGA